MNQQPRILVVDDEPMLLKATARQLEKAGYVAIQAKTGEAALALAREQQPDLILLDVVLPDIDGVEVCRRLKADPATAEALVVLLSGLKIDSDNQADGLEAGADGYIVRPISNRELLARVKGLIRLKRAETALKAYSERLEEMVEERTQALATAQEQLLRREKLAVLGQLSGGLAHQLRNPLGNIKNAAYLLNLAANRSELAVGEALAVLETEINRAERIISSLLDFARTKAPNRSQVDLDRLLQDVVAQVVLPVDPQIELVLEPAGNLPPIQADPDQLSQVFDNLIQNAAQAMPAGGRLKIKTEPVEPDWVAVTVADNGVGIPPENLAKIFEPLFTTKSKGIGLGLALIRNLVEANGGHIEAASEVGRGATFSLKLPLD